jgi:hypothetical protein
LCSWLPALMTVEKVQVFSKNAIWGNVHFYQSSTFWINKLYNIKTINSMYSVTVFSIQGANTKLSKVSNTLSSCTIYFVDNWYFLIKNSKIPIYVYYFWNEIINCWNSSLLMPCHNKHLWKIQRQNVQIWLERRCGYVTKVAYMVLPSLR